VKPTGPARLPLQAKTRHRIYHTMTDKPDQDWKRRATFAAGAAVGSAAVAAALLFVNKRRKERHEVPGLAKPKAPDYPTETD
jgi:anti-sigma-K factor RskA